MSDFPNGTETRADAISLLRRIDGRENGEISEWTLDDFSSVRHDDPKIDACRLRVRDELLNLLSSNDPSARAKITSLIDGLIKDLEVDASN